MTDESLVHEPVRENDTVLRAYVKMTWFRKLGLFKAPCTNFEGLRASNYTEINSLDLEI